RDGDPVTVLKAWCTGVRDVLAVRHVASPAETIVTPDHEFWVGELEAAGSSSIRARGLAALIERPTRQGPSKIDWKEIGAAATDLLLLPRRIAFELPDSLTIDLREFALRRERLPDRGRRRIEESYGLGYVFGSFFGDGSARVHARADSELGS